MPPRVQDSSTVGGGPRDLWENLPIVTKYWFGATLLLTLAGNLDMISVRNFPLHWESVYKEFEVWRLVTSFCYSGPFKMYTLIHLILLFQFSSRYEQGGPFNTGAGGGTADYAFMLLFGAITVVLTKPLLLFILPIRTSVYCNTMIFYVIYVWSKRFPTSNVNVWGLPIQAIYFPFAQVILSVFLQSPYMHMIHGIVVGHLYYFLVDVVPHVYGKDYLHTPQFLIDKFGIGMYQPAAVTNAPPPTQEPAHRWRGGGQRLGGNSGTASNNNSTTNNNATTGGESSSFGNAWDTGMRQRNVSSNNRGGSHNWGGGQRLGSD